MKIKGKKVSFPAELFVSLNPLVESLRVKRKTCSKLQQVYYDQVLKLVEDNPELTKPLSDKFIKDNSEIIDEFLSVAFPPVLETNEIKAVTTPWDFNMLKKSKRMESILKNAGEDFQLEFEGMNEEFRYEAACAAILGMYYKLPVPISRPYYLNIPNINTGITKCYRLTMNADFMQIEKTKKALDISQDDFHELIDNFKNPELWRSKFPENSWKFSGILITTLTDVTNDRLINNITNNLLNTEVDGILKLEKDISELLGTKIQLSFVSLNGSQLIQGRHPNIKPMILGKNVKADCKDMLCSYSYDELIKNDSPIAIPDIKTFHKKSKSSMSKNLVKTGLKSYFNTPIIYNGIKLGFLELGSETKGALNSTMEVRLEPVLPIIASAASRLEQERKNKIDALIQEEFTTIHPSVKWKFEDEAMDHLDSLENGEEHQFHDLVFDDVYPLFGQLDIRGSSTIRNDAIKSDLLSQLHSAKNILVEASTLKNLPIYDELIFTIDSHVYDLQIDMVSASEQDILSFFSKELEPILKHLATTDKNLKLTFQNYQNSLHENLHFVYEERRAFDESVNLINSSLAKYLDSKQDEAQEMFAHHFERYKTDGVEFNMYIGESISPNQGFHMLMVKNLRLWQLMVMIEMERLHKLNQKKMKKPLDVASLVLAFSNSLSIQFRMDEKRFDVEGAYNARYEIIKKRIDKAHIKGTNERITEPGKMAIVFSREEDEQEYKRYINYLQNKGYLKKEKIEIVTLEDLQGVSGLRAMRPSINYTSKDHVGDLTIEEIIAEIESGE